MTVRPGRRPASWGDASDGSADHGGPGRRRALLGACGAERPCRRSPPLRRAGHDDLHVEPPDERTVATTAGGADRQRSPTRGKVRTTEPTDGDDHGVPRRAAPPRSAGPRSTARAGRLIGSGDHAVGVAIAVDGEIVHRADLGYCADHRLPPSTLDSTATTPPSTRPRCRVDDRPATEPPEPIEPATASGSPASPRSSRRSSCCSSSRPARSSSTAGRRGARRQRRGDDHRPASPGITVRQLLSHTAGFESYHRTFFGGQVDSCRRPPTSVSRGLPPLPGTAYRYSNLNYCLLGLLVETRRRPALRGGGHRPPADAAGDRGHAPGGTFDRDPAEVIHPSSPFRNYMEALGAAGSWVATPSDIVTIIGSLDRRTPGLPPAVAADGRADAPAVPDRAIPEPGRWYGLGMMGFGDGSFGHTGTVESTTRWWSTARRRHVVGARQRRVPVGVERPAGHRRSVAGRCRHRLRLSRRRHPTSTSYPFSRLAILLTSVSRVRTVRERLDGYERRRTTVLRSRGLMCRSVGASIRAVGRARSRWSGSGAIIAGPTVLFGVR